MSTEPDPTVTESDPALFPYQRKRRPKTPTDPALAAALQHLMFRVYGSLYRKRFGQVPLMCKRDWGTLKRLVVQYGADTVETYLRAFLAWDAANDPWVQQEGWTLTVLVNRWNKLTVVIRGTRPRFVCDHQPPCTSQADHSQRNLQALRTP
jgi:hypothetical protein